MNHQASTTNAPLVDVRGISRRLGTHQALDDVSLQVRAGDIVGVIGRSGAGKSTLIRCLNGLETVDRGSIAIDGIDITRASDAALRRARQRIGMVFQHFNLLAAKTVADNVGLPLLIAGSGRAQREARVRELLALVGLEAHANKYPGALSGGQKQRVGIARALAASPALLLCDEATSALDPETTRSILELLADINRRLGVTVVLVTHEMSVIRALARRMVVLDHGRVVEEGEVAGIFTAPASDVTRSLLRGTRPGLPPDLAARLRPAPFAGAAALLRIELAGHDAGTALLSELTQQLGVVPRLLHGGVERVQGTAIGTLFVALDAADAPATLPDTLAFLAARTQHTEHLGYVATPA